MKIECHDYSIRRICLDWHDGPKTAMHKLCKGKPFSPATLLKETNQAIANCSLGEAEVSRLQRVAEYARRNIDKQKARAAIERAARAAREAGISFDRFKLIAGQVY
ncbi:hypothetical protein [Phaeobacter gallaeciensis]|uniref:hypothetical protein n=1 Tax=Phaeobacter gallaeciensis TaxID=60890 RepID=UPI00237F853C|nr:hypothetical protein [Phaeobacter gallaeciensis]MDE4098982.1 hypothetical protein [Phaeobacter gallaeciensis]MDE4107792.1 hypothetical protein [Phaeobacter gallaeciensis]MDE4112246.1 hypothetical protein [Phaeobacter gallaeciensis]MDE4116718.1 hypothetical protein [Phaeobacter gallaeciensis]MDE4121188.1 hypothetical protein [Phaeobacter gallaeciensis]